MVSASVPSMSNRNAVCSTTVVPTARTDRHPSVAPFRRRARHFSQRNAGQQTSLTGLKILLLAQRKAKALNNVVSVFSCSREPVAQVRRRLPPRVSLAPENLNRHKPSSDYGPGTSSVTRSPLHSFSSTIEANRIGTSLAPRRSAVRKCPGADDRVSSVKSS